MAETLRCGEGGRSQDPELVEGREKNGEIGKDARRSGRDEDGGGETGREVNYEKRKNEDDEI